MDVEFRFSYRGHPITIDMQLLPDDTKYEGLPYRDYLSVSKLALIDGCYYRPSSDSEETLDGFL
jgi:hypothetical protein